jgi:hypothetical protein
MIVNVIIEHRNDGGLRVYSKDLPELILSGSDKIEVMASIRPAVMELLLAKSGEIPKSLRIDVTILK